MRSFHHGYHAYDASFSAIRPSAHVDLAFKLVVRDGESFRREEHAPGVVQAVHDAQDGVLGNALAVKHADVRDLARDAPTNHSGNLLGQNFLFVQSEADVRAFLTVAPTK